MVPHGSAYCEVSGFRQLEELAWNLRGELHVLTQDGTASPWWERWLLQACDRICKGSAKGKEVGFDEYNDFKDTITNFSHFMLHLSKTYLSFTGITWALERISYLQRLKKTPYLKMKLLSFFTHTVPNLFNFIMSDKHKISKQCNLQCWVNCTFSSISDITIWDNKLLQYLTSKC